jgi:hypothetical protein
MRSTPTSATWCPDQIPKCSPRRSAASVGAVRRERPHPPLKRRPTGTWRVRKWSLWRGSCGASARRAASVRCARSPPNWNAPGASKRERAERGWARTADEAVVQGERLAASSPTFWPASTSRRQGGLSHGIAFSFLERNEISGRAPCHRRIATPGWLCTHTTPSLRTGMS